MENYDIILIGSLLYNNDYLCVRTFYLYEILKKYLPNSKIGVYDVYEEDSKRISKENAKNYIFLPWIETIDLNWCNFFLSLPEASKKILYTDDFHWYKEQQKRILRYGFNLENIFNVVAFSDNKDIISSDEEILKFWGPVIYHKYFEQFDFEKIYAEKNGKYIFVDAPWDLKTCKEPYNAIRVLNECMPQIKKNHPEYKVISQQNNESWVDQNIPKRIPLSEIIQYYSVSDAYILSHRELFGIAQIDTRMCGTRIVSTKDFSSSSILLPGPYTQSLWSFEKGNQNFIDSVENCLVDYDREKIRQKTKTTFDEGLIFDQIKKDLWSIDELLTNIN